LKRSVAPIHRHADMAGRIALIADTRSTHLDSKLAEFAKRSLELAGDLKADIERFAKSAIQAVDTRLSALTDQIDIEATRSRYLSASH
jgi:hypothetical protein